MQMFKPSLRGASLGFRRIEPGPKIVNGGLHLIPFPLNRFMKTLPVMS